MLSVFDWMQNVMNEGVNDWMIEWMNYPLYFYVMNVMDEWYEWLYDWNLLSCPDLIFDYAIVLANLSFNLVKL